MPIFLVYSFFGYLPCTFFSFAGLVSSFAPVSPSSTHFAVADIPHQTLTARNIRCRCALPHSLPGDQAKDKNMCVAATRPPPPPLPLTRTKTAAVDRTDTTANLVCQEKRKKEEEKRRRGQTDTAAAAADTLLNHISVVLMMAVAQVETVHCIILIIIAHFHFRQSTAPLAQQKRSFRCLKRRMSLGDDK